ncbi:MAG: hypothetical protein ACLTBV_00620 [Enterocloster bolteae]
MTRVRGRVALGGGPGICVGIMGHPVMNRILEQAAGRLDIRTQPVTNAPEEPLQIRTPYISADTVCRQRW